VDIRKRNETDVSPTVVMYSSFGPAAAAAAANTRPAAVTRIETNEMSAMQSPPPHPRLSHTTSFEPHHLAQAHAQLTSARMAVAHVQEGQRAARSTQQKKSGNETHHSLGPSAAHTGHSLSRLSRRGCTSGVAITTRPAESTCQQAEATRACMANSRCQREEMEPWHPHTRE
jgi:hypothetical protein